MPHAARRLLIALTAGTSLCLAGCTPPPAPTGQAAESLRLGELEQDQGSPDSSLRLAQQVLARDPHDPRALVLAANAQSALGQTSLALASYRAALAAAPANADAARGVIRLGLQADPAAAAVALRRLVRQTPADARLWTDLGVACDLLGHPAEAQAAYRQALLHDPSMVAAQLDLGLSLALSGDGAQAVAMLRPLARTAAATARVRADLAVAEVASGNTDAARALLAQDVPPDQADRAIARYAALTHASP